MHCEVHEFWLRKYSERFGDGDERLPTYRVALGELIPAQQRKTFTPRWGDGAKNPDMWNNSGSIGFMDLTVREEFVPKDETQLEDHERIKALVILVMGIEPRYRNMVYARFLKQRAEELALEWDLNTIVVSMIQHPKIGRLIVRLGYTLYDRGTNAVKRIYPD